MERNILKARAAWSAAAHVAPFAAWMVLMALLPADAASYAARSAATAATALALLAFGLKKGFVRPRIPQWRGAAGALAAGIAAGTVVAALWILPESSAFYRTWLCWPVGSAPADAGGASPYDPAVCGWPLTVARLAGSAFVIAPAEELFFRSFLYRRLQARDFASVPLSRFDASAFAWTVLLFSLEHDRLAAAAVAGAIYGAVAMRRGIAAAIAAHATTNLLLGIFVIASGRWVFW